MANLEVQSRWYATNIYRIPRMAAIVLMLLCLAASGASGRPLSCSQQGFSINAGVDHQTVSIQRLCRDAAMTDPFAIALGIAILLLIFPEMSEVGGFGITLKRRVAQAEASTAQAKSQLAGFQMKLAEIQASANVNNQIFIGNLKAVPNDVQRKVSLWNPSFPPESVSVGAVAQAEVEEVEAAPMEPQEPEGASRQLQLLRLAAALDLQVAALPQPSRSRFERIFHDELEAVRAARNTVAHSRSISDGDLQAALEATSELTRLASQPPVD
jgi:hypothetical protein